MTLTRFYSLHVGVLPAATLGLVVGHIALSGKHGVTPPASADPKKVNRFYPKQVAMDLAVGLVVLGILFALTLREHGAPLDAPAESVERLPGASRVVLPRAV